MAPYCSRCSNRRVPRASQDGSDGPGGGWSSCSSAWAGSGALGTLGGGAALARHAISPVGPQEADFGRLRAASGRRVRFDSMASRGLPAGTTRSAGARASSVPLAAAASDRERLLDFRIGGSP